MSSFKSMLRLLSLPLLFNLLFFQSHAQEGEEGIKLSAAIATSHDNFGKAVAVDGNFSLIGAWTEDEKGPEAGAAYLYHRPNKESKKWTLLKKLVASDGEAFNNFGGQVAIHGDYALISAEGNDNFAGAAYVFYRHEGGKDNWGEIQKLYAYDKKSGDYFGNSIAIYANQIAIGAFGNDDKGRSAGAVYTFELKEGKWKFHSKINDSEGLANDRFGTSVAINENNLVVGASRDNKTGSIIIYNKENKTWTQVLKIFASDGMPKDRFGNSLALEGDHLVVGADCADGYAGAVYVFEKNLGGQNNWGERTKIQVEDGDLNDRFGKSLAISGDYLLVGSEGHEMSMGASYLFRKDKNGQNNWGLANKMNAIDGAPKDLFGSSVALAGDDIMIGAYNADNKGGAYHYKAIDKSIFASKGNDE